VGVLAVLQLAVVNVAARLLVFCAIAAEAWEMVSILRVKERLDILNVLAVAIVGLLVEIIVED